MRNEDLRWIDERLYQWASWSKNHCLKIGYPTRTCEHRIIVEGMEGAAIRKEKTGVAPIYMPEEIAQTESAILAIRNPKLRDIIKIKYLKHGTDAERMKELSIAWSQHLNIATYRRMLERALYWLSGAMSKNSEDDAN